jgi:signal transduction histidine kinase
LYSILFQAEIPNGCANRPAQLSPELKLVLYRITQEALNNIVKHAQASQVEIRLAQVGPSSTFEIRDDGIGFDPAQLKPTRMGLNIMRERAASVGATVDIHSTPGEGTQIMVKWDNSAGKANS